MDYQLYNGECCMNKKGCTRRCCCKLNTYDWLCDISSSEAATDYVEVQFKNTRKAYYLNSNKIPLEKGDVVAVESNPGHDIGTVTMTGQLVLLQMKKHRIRSDAEVKKVYRKAKAADLEKFEEAKAKEHETMIRSRKIAERLGLQMKIGDVEYQGDGNKAIFYYIADERVDFRQLIKDLAEAFHIRIEMKQIGARQEAGRIGGIGPCGRELCCSGWMGNFVSVSTGAARLQDIAMNPQKLAGQCAKLKCCLNYEVDDYMEAQRKFPSREIRLETKDNTYYHFKTDVFKNQMQYSTDRHVPANLVTISSERAYEVINMNRRGHRPLFLHTDEQDASLKKEYQDILDESVSRFDPFRKKKKNKKIVKRNQNELPQT
jgi:cell fate regulator YaaT (PSP1 superfamily)